MSSPMQTSFLACESLYILLPTPWPEPPTFYHTNKFTACFQQLVDVGELLLLCSGVVRRCHQLHQLAVGQQQGGINGHKR